MVVCCISQLSYMNCTIAMSITIDKICHYKNKIKEAGL